MVLAQTVEDVRDPNHEPLAENIERLRAATDARGRPLEVIDLSVLPRPRVRGQPGVVPYTNLYVVNDAAVVPICGDDPDRDEDVLRMLASVFAPREVVPVPSRVLAEGGGGVHCITQQVPAGLIDISRRRGAGLPHPAAREMYRMNLFKSAEACHQLMGLREVRRGIRVPWKRR